MRVPLLAQQVMVFVAVLVLWALGDRLGWFNPDVIPPLTDIGDAIVTLFGRPDLPLALWYTLRDSLVWCFLCCGAGHPAGAFDRKFQQSRTLDPRDPRFWPCVPCDRIGSNFYSDFRHQPHIQDHHDLDRLFLPYHRANDLRCAAAG